MTNTTKLILRIWLALTSTAAFLFGWGVLAHAPKTEAGSGQDQASQAEPVNSGQAPAQLVQLAPVPSLDELRAGATLSSAPAPSIRFSTVQSAPRLRTRGS